MSITLNKIFRNKYNELCNTIRQKYPDFSKEIIYKSIDRYLLLGKYKTVINNFNNLFLKQCHFNKHCLRNNNCFYCHDTDNLELLNIIKTEFVEEIHELLKLDYSLDVNILEDNLLYSTDICFKKLYHTKDPRIIKMVNDELKYVRVSNFKERDYSVPLVKDLKLQI